MEVLLVLVPFLVLGVGVIFVAFAGGAGRAREVYLSRGGRAFAAVILLLYLVLGIAVPAGVIAGRDESLGGVGSLRTAQLTDREKEGKELFEQTCKSCHNLDAGRAPHRRGRAGRGALRGACRRAVEATRRDAILELPASSGVFPSDGWCLLIAWRRPSKPKSVEGVGEPDGRRRPGANRG